MRKTNGYNRIVKVSTTAAAVLAFSIAGLAGCGKNVDNKEAVRQGVMNYLAKRSDLLAMDVTVTSVAFAQDEATATVHFQAKGNSSPAAGMNMQYVLERKGNEWAVKGRAGSGAPHAGIPQGGSAAPGSGSGSLSPMPNTGTGPAPGGAETLPPGHPSVSGGAEGGGALPPGHPSIGSQPSNGPSK
jgi:hypothetical protein